MGGTITFPDLPIVGKAFEILATYPTAVIQCGCEAKSVVVLVSALSAAECPACHRSYAILKQPAVTIGLVRQPVES